MPVQSKKPVTNLPLPPAPAPAPINPVGQSTVATAPSTLTPGLKPLVIAGTTVNVDVTKHTAANIVDLINGANIGGVTASLDRYGNLVINGVIAGQVAGDLGTLQSLGLA